MAGATKFEVTQYLLSSLVPHVRPREGKRCASTTQPVFGTATSRSQASSLHAHPPREPFRNIRWRLGPQMSHGERSHPGPNSARLSRLFCGKSCALMPKTPRVISQHLLAHLTASCSESGISADISQHLLGAFSNKGKRHLRGSQLGSYS